MPEVQPASTRTRLSDWSRSLDMMSYATVFVAGSTPSTRTFTLRPPALSTNFSLDAAPAVVLTTRNFARLEAFARCTLPADHPMRPVLLDKLARCRVVEPGDVPADVATLNSRISYAVRGRTVESRVLTEPDTTQTFGRDQQQSTQSGQQNVNNTSSGLENGRRGASR